MVGVSAPRAAASGGCAPTLPPAGGRRTRWLLHSTADSKIPAAQRAAGILVPVVGLEPTPCRQERILSPSRLPFHHTGKYAIFFYRPERILSPSRRPRKLRIPRFGLASKARSLCCSSFPHSAGLVGSPGASITPANMQFSSARQHQILRHYTGCGGGIQVLFWRLRAKMNGM